MERWVQNYFSIKGHVLPAVGTPFACACFVNFKPGAKAEQPTPSHPTTGHVPVTKSSARARPTPAARPPPPPHPRPPRRPPRRQVRPPQALGVPPPLTRLPRRPRRPRRRRRLRRTRPRRRPHPSHPPFPPPRRH